MKRIYEGWLSRDASGELYFGQEKPIDNGGIWNDMGENMQLRDSDFPEVRFDNSPVHVEMIIREYGTKVKQIISVDGNATAIMKIPCVIGCCKGKDGILYYQVRDDDSGIISLAAPGDFIMEDLEGKWYVIARYNKKN